MPDSLTLINHSTILLQLGKVTVITDPIYSRTISYIFPRRQKPGIAFSELPPIDAILVSHHDYDHLNMKTLRRLRRRRSSTIIMPRGLARYGERAGFEDIVELRWWEGCQRGPLKVTCVPAKHSSKRSPVDRERSACCGYVVEGNGRIVYFAGDTGYDAFFSEIGLRFNIDVALLPIGAYKPYEWFKDKHLHPHTAIQAFLDLRARHLIPMHWGTFWISDEPMDEPPRLLREEAERRGLQERVHILRNGGQFAM
jgi:L-ascorbate metabolism protein UlaG (beta-lactamase superfamily)